MLLVDCINKFAPVYEGMLFSAAASASTSPSAAAPFVGGGADWTYGDVLVAEAVQGYCELLGEGWLGSFPLLAAHRKRIVALPGAHC